LSGAEPPPVQVQRLEWRDEELGSIDLPSRPLQVRSGFGSGLSRPPGGDSATIWAICDRGPNLKIKTLVKRYGMAALEKLGHLDGAKVMPRLDLGPALAELRVAEDRVELVRSLRVSDPQGAPVSGLPVPEGPHVECEPALDLAGNILDPDPSGMDTEGIAALADGGFWVSEEFGPSLALLDPGGRVLRRLVPAGTDLHGAAYPVEATLPAIAAKRKLNRGFEAIAVSPNQEWLFLAFQSPLAHPDEEAHEQARHVRIWRLDLAAEEVVAQYLYPLDPPESFLRDCAKDEMKWSDLKVSELAWAGPDRLLVLERGSETTRIYRIALGDDLETPSRHLDTDTRPTIEELSGRGELGLPVLEKVLLFDSDRAPEVAADLEGMVILSDSELLLVNDNDFGVEGAETSFWKIRLLDRTLSEEERSESG
jgi:hypothetical protein